MVYRLSWFQIIVIIKKGEIVEAYVIWSFDDTKDERDSSQEFKNARRTMYIVRILERIP